MSLFINTNKFTIERNTTYSNIYYVKADDHTIAVITSKRMLEAFMDALEWKGNKRNIDK